MFEWLEHAWATHDTGLTELVVIPFLPCLQGRSALHRLRAKDRGDAENRSQAMSAEVRSWAVESIGENSFAHRHFYSIPHSGWKSWSQIETPKAFAGHAFNIPSQTKVRAGEARALPGHLRLFA
jgi:hypothetical protein